MFKPKMLKKFGAAFAAFVAVSAVANTVHADHLGRPGIPGGAPMGGIGTIGSDIAQQSREVSQALRERAHMLSGAQALEVRRLLTQIENVIGVYGVPGGAPGVPPRPIPLPPRPIPPRYELMCERDDVASMARAINLVREFAYAGNGLNMMSREAAQFAQQFVATHPCREADSYVRDGYSIREMAYSGTGLNMMSSEAASYTIAALERRCIPGVDYVGEARRIYEIAYSGSGLNMSSREASAYTRSRIEERFLNCR